MPCAPCMSHVFFKILKSHLDPRVEQREVRDVEGHLHTHADSMTPASEMPGFGGALPGSSAEPTTTTGVVIRTP